MRKCKGCKFRSIFLGKKTCSTVRAYLRFRQDNKQTMWVVQNGDRRTYWGLRQIKVGVQYKQE
jgi:hypothetical protein